MMEQMTHTVEYQLIHRFYGDRVARRSQVPLINHIDEGLVVLSAIGATDAAKRAFCIHPMFQADEDLQEHYYLASSIDSHVLMLAMEYRSVANEFLSDKINTEQKIRLSPLKEVNQMLVADKVQNYKDFLTYHHCTHERSDELPEYFDRWLKRLEIDGATFLDLCKAIDQRKAG